MPENWELGANAVMLENQVTCLDKLYLKPGWEFGPHQYEEVFHVPWDLRISHDCAKCQICYTYRCEE